MNTSKTIKSLCFFFYSFSVFAQLTIDIPSIPRTVYENASAFEKFRIETFLSNLDQVAENQAGRMLSVGQRKFIIDTAINEVISFRTLKNTEQSVGIKLVKDFLLDMKKNYNTLKINQSMKNYLKIPSGLFELPVNHIYETLFKEVILDPNYSGLTSQTYHLEVLKKLFAKKGMEDFMAYSLLKTERKVFTFVYTFFIPDSTIDLPIYAKAYRNFRFFNITKDLDVHTLFNVPIGKNLGTDKITAMIFSAHKTRIKDVLKSIFKSAIR
jgi:hypothetical protein